MAKGAWIAFVQKVHKENPGKSYGEAMKIASTLKKKGKMSMNMNMNKKGKKSKKTRKTRKSKK
jgi:hypothetical protein